jgi:hypothetical protein
LLVASLVVEFASVPASAVESDVDREAQRVVSPAGVVTTPPTVAIPRPDRHLSSWKVSSRQSARQPTAPSFPPDPPAVPTSEGAAPATSDWSFYNGGHVAVASVSNSSTCGSAVIERTIRRQGHYGRHGCRGGSCQPGFTPVIGPGSAPGASKAVLGPELAQHPVAARRFRRTDVVDVPESVRRKWPVWQLYLSATTFA